MIIKRNQEKFIIKAKKGTIELSDKIKIGDFEIPGDGEYEVEGTIVELKGEVSLIHAEDINIVFLDSLSRPLKKEEIEQMSAVDILIIPVGGGEVLDGKKALELISEIEPKIVIPARYKDLGSFASQEGLKIEETDQLKVVKTNIGEECRVVALESEK